MGVRWQTESVVQVQENQVLLHHHPERNIDSQSDSGQKPMEMENLRSDER